MLTNLEIKASITILKPIEVVFEAIADHTQMCNYFIATSTGPMETGKTVTWKFPEFDMEFPIRIGKVEKPFYISYYWSDENSEETLVEMKLEEKDQSKTTVRITEKCRDNDEAGILWFGRNTEGWANFLACLKAWVEYGINLRKGAFE